MRRQRTETTVAAFGSRDRALLVAAALSVGCAASPPSAPQQQATVITIDSPAARSSDATAGPAAVAEEIPAEPSLGVADRGIFADLDARVQLALPAGLDPSRVTATVDVAHAVLVLRVDGWPTKPYPLGGDAPLELGEHHLALREGDRAELEPLLRADSLQAVDGAAAEPAGDRDDDGIPDTLDVLVGAHKAALNADAYQGGYVAIDYPGGDVPRTIGVCTDVVIRALRNAGLDLQREVHRDIARAPRRYPMVKGDGDASIDHRRVKTILPYFQHHLAAHSARPDDPDDPLRPGDIVFLDTFPDRPGPDHIGVISDRRGDSGLFVVINNWTDGTVTAEMDLLGWLPITHRFRMP